MEMAVDEPSTSTSGVEAMMEVEDFHTAAVDPPQTGLDPAPLPVDPSTATIDPLPAVMEQTTDVPAAASISQVRTVYPVRPFQK